MNKIRTILSFSALYSSHFLFLGLLLPFFSAWLALKGFSASEIGLINGIALAGRLIGGTIIAVIADRQDDKRRVLLSVTSIFAFFAVLLVIIDIRIVIAVSAVMIIWGFGLLMPLTDSMVLRADRNGLLQYGKVRSVGSIAFLLTTLAGGMILTGKGFGAVAFGLTGSAIAAVLITLFLPKIENRIVAQDDVPKIGIQWQDVGFLLRHPIFWMALLAAGFAQGAHAVYYAYSVLRWTEIGYSPTVIGWLWALGVLAEILLLIKARTITQRLNPALLLAIGGGAALIRWTVTALEPNLWILFIIQLFHALTFGATYLGSIEFLDKAIPVRFMNTGMVLFSATGIGAFMGVATILSGYIFELFGAASAYFMMAGMGAIALGIACWVYRSWNGKMIVT